MKRPHRAPDGHYHIDGKKFKELFGSRIQVWNGTAYKTEGNLVRKDLMMNRWNRIVSQKKHKTAKKEKRLQKYGYFAEKGKFGFVKRDTKKRRSMKKKGGSAMPALTPANADAGAPASFPAVANAGGNAAPAEAAK